MPDLNEPGALEPVGRRGLALIQTFMDEVLYNEKGNEVRLVKRAVPKTAGAPA
ncbi:MAG: ATP-binding protein [Thermoguttaceae bacterium]